MCICAGVLGGVAWMTEVCVSCICVHVYTFVLEVCVDECVYERACWAAWPG